MDSRKSSYLECLPAIYSDDDFMGRFLLVFEEIMGPIERIADNRHHYFDTRLAPPDMLPWLAQWVGLVLDERWSEERRRQLIRAAVELYSWRGTKRGLREMIRLYTGCEAKIDEPGLKARGRSKKAAENAHRFRVTLDVPKDASVDRAMVERIIEMEKPAHTEFELIMGGEGPGGDKPGGGS